MKNYMRKITGVAVPICMLAVFGCAATASHEGIDANTYKLTVHQVRNLKIWTGEVTTDAFTEWDRKAAKLCGGGYETVSRQLVANPAGNDYLIGEITCK
jgi:hypothetical protein